MIDQGTASSAEARSTVLLVDDDQGRARGPAAALEIAGYRLIKAAEGAAALRLLSAHECDLVVCEALLPDMDGLDVCRAIKQAPATRETSVVVIVDSEDDVKREKALSAGADDVCARPFDDATLLGIVRAQFRIRALRLQIYELEGAVLTLARSVEDRDHSSGGISEKVAHWAMQLGEACGLGKDQLTLLYKAALLHDVGSVAVPVEVLTKHARLDPSEFNAVKRHPIVGEEILRALPGSDQLLPAIRHHHERIDGAGYPDGVIGESIPLFARIIAVSDAFVAMTSDRPYRPRRTKEEAVRTLRQGAGKQWDAALVDRFLGLVAGADAHEARLSGAG
ncbi:MAG: response regulator [Chloroflexi bacterium]|nr:MAG: response regulator [Chloroflexota bacterium]TME45896.1 MAG: response regulator [Chloroflexota bacterium]